MTTATSTRKARWILALDPGTRHLGFCLGRVDGPGRYCAEQLGTYHVPEGKIQERLGFLKPKIEALLEAADDLDAECVVEQPGVWGSKLATIAILRVNGHILTEIGARKLRFYEYLPNVWKQVCGAGNASKDRVAYAVRNLLQLPSLPAPDAADAAGLFLWHAMRGN